jgi:hypothetical protein
MDALVQLYGRFDLDNDSLPHFDTNGEPVPGDDQTHLSLQLQIAFSEGCCKREGSGIGSLVTLGRYVVLIFHCSIGPNENRLYKVTYTLDKKARIPFIRLNTMQLANPSLYTRAVNKLYRVVDTDGQKLVTQLGQVYKVSVRTEDAATQGQLRVAVFTYAYKKVPMRVERRGVNRSRMDAMILKGLPQDEKTPPKPTTWHWHFRGETQCI